MTREVAKREIESLDYYLQNHTNDYSEESHTAMVMAIKALEQEPSGDAISRQAVHIELEKWITYGEYKYSNATKYLYDRIDRLPPVNPQEPKWISVSERLPEEDDFYLVTAKVGNEFIIDISEYTPKNDSWDIPHEIVAWMPLPEPYKPQKRSE